MTADELVHMANQIALFFAAYPDDDAVAGVADHLRRFWPVQQRARLAAAREDAAAARAMHPLVVRALVRLGDEAR